jgi:hypothetical protein
MLAQFWMGWYVENKYLVHFAGDMDTVGLIQDISVRFLFCAF